LLLGQSAVSADTIDEDKRRAVVEELGRILTSFDQNGDDRLDASERDRLSSHVAENYGRQWVSPLQIVFKQADSSGDGVLTKQEWENYSEPRDPARVDGNETEKGKETERPKEKAGETFFKLYPVGKVEQLADGSARIRISDRYADALLGLDGWSHVNVLWWFDKNDDPQRRGILRVHPRGNRENPLTGVFACRAPVRPNLIALTVCNILSVEGNVLHVDKIEAFDGTPVLDLKPLIPPDVPRQGIKVPDWTGRK
jgi:tRNA-Thr(GGU) m(6)t(6)A37 methyltransferase TsaA